MGTKFQECWNRCQTAQDRCTRGCGSDECCKYRCIDQGIACKQQCGGGAVSDYAVRVEGWVQDDIVPSDVKQLLQDMQSDMQLMITSYNELVTAYHELMITYFAIVGYVPSVDAGDCGCSPT